MTEKNIQLRSADKTIILYPITKAENVDGLSTVLSTKQNALTAGNGITLSGNTVSLSVVGPKINNETDMNAIVTTANVGRIVFYNGPTTSSYATNTFYMIVYGTSESEAKVQSFATAGGPTVVTSASTTAGEVYDVTYINTMLGNIETLLASL